MAITKSKIDSKISIDYTIPEPVINPDSVMQILKRSFYDNDIHVALKFSLMDSDLTAKSVVESFEVMAIYRATQWILAYGFRFSCISIFSYSQAAIKPLLNVANNSKIVIECRRCPERRLGASISHLPGFLETVAFQSWHTTSGILFLGNATYLVQIGNRAEILPRRQHTLDEWGVLLHR